MIRVWTLELRLSLPYKLTDLTTDKDALRLSCKYKYVTTWDHEAMTEIRMKYKTVQNKATSV